jgi:hypothetical protein
MPWLRGGQKKDLPLAALHLNIASRRSPTHTNCTTTPQNTSTHKPKRHTEMFCSLPLVKLASKKNFHIPRAPDPLHPDFRQCPKIPQVRFEPAQKKVQKGRSWPRSCGFVKIEKKKRGLKVERRPEQQQQHITTSRADSTYRLGSKLKILRQHRFIQLGWNRPFSYHVLDLMEYSVN